MGLVCDGELFVEGAVCASRRPAPRRKTSEQESFFSIMETSEEMNQTQRVKLSG
jgi:hypothetical protein